MVRLYEKNAKKHPDNQLKLIARSLREYGWRQPIVTDKDDVIIVGHGRWLAYQKYPEGIKEPWIVKADDLTPEQVRGYRLMDNKTNESDWDMSLMLEELKELDLLGFDIDLTGFDRDLLISPDEKDDLIPENVETRCKKGDLWQLGRHRLLCGDSTKKEDVERLVGKSIQEVIIITDPPYGIDIVNSGNVDITAPVGFSKGKVGTKGLVPAGSYSKVIGDDKPFDPSFLLTLADKVFLWGANNYASKLPDNAHWLVWDKKVEKGADHNNFSDCELMWTNIKQKSVRIYRYLWSGLLREGNRSDELSKRVHPTQKPVGLMVEIINDYTKPNDIILDLFLGSGSTLIASQKTGRIAFGCEIDERYCDIIIARWEAYTGKTAKLIDNNLTT